MRSWADLGLWQWWPQNAICDLLGFSLVWLSSWCSGESPGSRNGSVVFACWKYKGKAPLGFPRSRGKALSKDWWLPQFLLQVKPRARGALRAGAVWHMCPQSHPCYVPAQLNPSSRNSVETKTSSRRGKKPQSQQPPPKIHQIPNPQRAPSEVMLLPWGWVKIPQPGASLDVTAPFPQDEFKFSYTAESPAWDLFFWAVTPDHFVLHNGNMVHSFWLLPGRSCVESGPISCWFSVLLLPISKWKTELIPISHPPPCNCPHRLSTSPQTPMASDCHWGCVGWCETFPASVLTYCSADSRSHQNPPLEHSPLQILIAVDSWELDGIWWF